MQLSKILVNIFITVISFLIPKSKEYIVVGGWYGKRFADNSRACYEYLQSNKQELGIKRVFWYTNSNEIFEELQCQGSDVLKGLNVKSIYWHFRAGIHIIDCSTHDILGFLSVRSIRIDLWHGTPLKNVGYLINGVEPPKGIKKIISFLASGGYWDRRYVLAPSPFVRNLLSKIKGIDEERFFISSYPRNNTLYYTNKLSEREYIVFYLPTFRSNGKQNPILSYDFNKLNQIFSLKGIKFIVKPHFADIANWEDKGNYTNITIVDRKVDVYDQLLDTNLLVTDYSSVYYDFMITRRPVLFYPYDYEYYETSDRGFTVPYNEYTAGDKVYSSDELIKKILEIKEYENEYINKYSKQYEKILKETNAYTDRPNYLEMFRIMKLK